MNMTLEELGYHRELADYRTEHHLDAFGIGRVISEHKDRYSVKTVEGEYDAELIGHLRFAATDRSELPAVGDWVAISEYDEHKALIHAVFPRKSVLERKAVGQPGRTQIIATNIDVGLIVQAVDRDFSINRLERYLTICHAAGIEPIIVLSKVDLLEKEPLNAYMGQIRDRIPNVPVFAISNQTQAGIDALKAALVPGQTYCLLGSSGVGKSTLINSLAGDQLMETGEINQRIGRGKHITSHRELIVLERGILIDNPGMREVGIANMSEGLDMTFDEIASLAADCKYHDCSHTNETGCAVLQALEQGELDEGKYANYVRMERERKYFESDALERKKKDKDLGKLIKNVLKEKKRTKY